MTPEQFAYWLQGFVELTQGQTPNVAQWKAIRDHLDTVFKKVTPAVGEQVQPAKKTSSEFQKAVEDVLRRQREREDGPRRSYEPWFSPRIPSDPPYWLSPHFGDFPPGTIIC